jgi:imidazolonepropionase-like amidohydrolase
MNAIPPASNGRRVWLRLGTLLDGCAAKPLEDAHLVYDANAILYVGGAGHSPPMDLLNSGQTQPDLDMPGYTLLPGLIEAHAHLFLDGSEFDLEKRKANLRQTPEELLRAARARLDKLIRIGIIAVRDAGDKHGV